MSDFTWYAEPAEIPIGNPDIATSLLVGLGENSDRAERAAIVLSSKHLDVNIHLTAKELDELVEVLTDLAVAMNHGGRSES